MYSGDKSKTKFQKCRCAWAFQYGPKIVAFFPWVYSKINFSLINFCLSLYSFIIRLKSSSIEVLSFILRNYGWKYIWPRQNIFTNYRGNYTGMLDSKEKSWTTNANLQKIFYYLVNKEISACLHRDEHGWVCRNASSLCFVVLMNSPYYLTNSR